MDFIQDYFADFPEMQDEAINIVYDMCEDQGQEVRSIQHGTLRLYSNSYSRSG